MSNYNRRRNPRSDFKKDPKTLTILVTSRREDDKYEIITGYIFDVMFAIESDGMKTIFLKSHGFSINLCADLVIQLEKRFKNQFISYKKRIFLNSKFYSEDRNSQYKGKNPHKPRFNANKPNITSFMDVKFYID